MAHAESPQVSIALSMHNAARTIDMAICSLISQTFADWELLLLDDGSTDDSVQRARRYGDRRIRIVSDGRQCGLPVRLNQAIDFARGRYFARMDADDLAYPERLAKQVEFLQTHADVDLCGTAMLVFEGSGDPVGIFPSRVSHEEICARPLSGFYLPHPTWMGKSAWFRRWRYDPACRKAQDQDLLLRSYASSRFAALADVLVGYRQDRIALRKVMLGRYYFSRAIVRTAIQERRYAGGLAAVAAQMAKLGYDALAIGTGSARFMLRHRALPYSEEQGRRWRKVWTSCHDHIRSSPDQ